MHEIAFLKNCVSEIHTCNISGMAFIYGNFAMRYLRQVLNDDCSLMFH